MAKKKKPAKKPVMKKSVKKRAKRVVKKTTKTPVKKAAVRKPVAKKRPAKRPPMKTSLPRMLEPGFLSVQVAPALEDRLIDLAMHMAKPLDQVLAQALGEFADTWEDHGRTVAALNTEDDRAVLSVRPDKTVQANNSNE